MFRGVKPAHDMTDVTAFLNVSVLPVVSKAHDRLECRCMQSLAGFRFYSVS